MRRPRVKVAANLSIRRPSKAPSAAAGSSSSSGESKPVITAIQPPVPSEQDDLPRKVEVAEKAEEMDLSAPEEMEMKRPVCKVEQKPVPIAVPAVAEESAFKFPNPVEELPRITTPAPVPQSPLEINTEEPHSPKKLDSKFAYINALNSPRKRIRTESMTSNKSYSDVSLKSRKTIKQEESQKASDAKRDLRKRLNNIQNIDKQSLTMFDMIYYNPVKNPMKTPALSKKGSMENIPRTIDRESRSVSKSRSPTPAPMMAPPPVPEPPSAPPTLQMTPQIKLGPNGEMILDEASLVVENEREKALRDSLAKAEVVYMDEFSGNSGYYSRYKRTRDWPPEETIRFYRCLHTIGTDFSMMIQLFPNRTRRDLKLKFKKEERLNLKLVNKALLFPKEFNIEELSKQFQEEDEEIERQREEERQIKAELEEKLKQQKMSKKTQLNQSKNRNPKKRVSKAARAMLDIEKIANAGSMIEDAKPKRKRRKATRNDQSEEPATERRPRSKAASSKPRPATEEAEDDVFNESVAASISEDEPADDSSNREDRVSQVDSVPYIPNGGFEQQCLTPSTDPSQSTRNSSTVDLATSDSQLNIEAMDIDIVDEHSRSLYAIKAEPMVYPVQLYESASNVSLDAPSVVTLQSLDDSQTMVTYRRSKTSGSDPDRDLGIDAIESKYYGGYEVVCLPTQQQSMKTESSYCVTQQQQFLPTPVQSTPLQYDLHTIQQSDFVTSQPAHVKPDVQESETSQGSYPVTRNPSPVMVIPDETNPSSDSLPMKPEDDSGESPTEDSNDWQESEYSEEQMVEEQAGAVQDDQEPEEQVEDDEEPRGLGPLEDIDINSLVLVESQDTNDPTKTIYEIYVTDPETGKLSEKPLDVPGDVIENIRSILEGGEE